MEIMQQKERKVINLQNTMYNNVKRHLKPYSNIGFGKFFYVS